MNVLSLCSGAGGLEMGIKLAVPSASTIAYCERDACAVEVLAARMEDGSVEAAPIFFDLAGIDEFVFAGIVDLVAAGFPCQPHSLAGKRSGVADERWIWDDIWRVVRDVRAPLLFVENVPGLLTSGGFDRVLADLAAGGWAAEWDCVPAAAVGAPHLRDRLFLLAADPERIELRQQSGRGEPGWPGALFAGAAGPERHIADPNCNGLADERWLATEGPNADGRARAREVAEAEREGLEERRVEPHRDERAPAERDRDGWAGRPAPEPTLRGVDDGLARQLDGDRLFVLGNGVVPQAAAFAWRVLWERLMT